MTHGEPDLSDLQVVNGALDGDPSMAQELITRLECVPLILQARNQRLGGFLSDEELIDLTQDTLEAVWRKLPTFGGRASLETWVFAYCNHQMLNAIRNKRRRHVFPEEHATGVDEMVQPTPEQGALEYEHVHRSLELIDAHQASVIRLKHFEQMTFTEVARTLTLSPNTVKTLYYRGLESLRSMLLRNYSKSFA